MMPPSAIIGAARRPALAHQATIIIHWAKVELRVLVAREQKAQGIGRAVKRLARLVSAARGCTTVGNSHASEPKSAIAVCRVRRIGEMTTNVSSASSKPVDRLHGGVGRDRVSRP
eukprot:scaffold83613_cov34-Tisochrysis_lutea.AAC.2